MEVLIHFAVTFALFYGLGLSLRWSILAGAIGVMPDLDVLLHVHRSASHSLVFPILLIVLAVPLWSRARVRRLSLLSALSLLSHILLDFPTGYTPLLWPISDSAYKLHLESKLLMESTATLSFNLQILQDPFYQHTSTTLNVVLFTIEGLIIGLLLIALPIMLKGRQALLTQNTAPER